MYSFTFFSQYPYQEPSPNEKSHIEAEKRGEATAKQLNYLRLVTAKAMVHSVGVELEHDAAAKEYYRRMAEALNSEVRYRDQDKVIVKLVEIQIGNPPPPLETQTDDGGAPISAETWLGLEKIFCNTVSKVVGGLTPELKGVLGKVFEAAVDQGAEKFFEWNVRVPVNARTGIVDRLATRSEQWARQTIFDAPDHALKGTEGRNGLNPEFIEEVRKEIQSEVDAEVKRQRKEIEKERINERSTEREIERFERVP
jgi:hypothetical protein